MTGSTTIYEIGSIERSNDGFSICISKEYRDGLIELDKFSHAIIVWWCSFVDKPQYRKICTMNKPYKKGPDIIGVFATRSPVRPNPIAISTVQIIGIEQAKGIVRVPYIDAEPGTPVLDIKPYHPSEDRIKNIDMPRWCSHWPMWNEESEDFNWEEEFNFPNA